MGSVLPVISLPDCCRIYYIRATPGLQDGTVATGAEYGPFQQMQQRQGQRGGVTKVLARQGMGFSVEFMAHNALRHIMQRSVQEFNGSHPGNDGKNPGPFGGNA